MNIFFVVDKRITHFSILYNLNVIRSAHIPEASAVHTTMMIRASGQRALKKQKTLDIYLDTHPTAMGVKFRPK